MASKSHQLTPDQLAVKEERMRKKAAAKAAAPAPTHTKSTDAAPLIITRPWMEVNPSGGDGAEQLTVLTWNLLAQCLVRRELFPNSDCLKGAQRERMTYEELSSPGADVLCLQEVDRLGKILPYLGKCGYEHVYAAGPGKKHGCLIAYRKGKFEQRETHAIVYDEVDVHEEGTDAQRKGLSFRTRNIASFVALARSGSDTGVVIATTHLFWHPSYKYERARQAGILRREVIKFRDKHGLTTWPCIIAGDFNFDPIDPVYSLLVGDPLLPAQVEKIARSRVVHVSVDPSVPVTQSGPADDEGSGETDPDRIITNARPPKDSDGLLDDEAFRRLYALDSAGVRLRSAYDDGQRLLAHAGPIDRYGERLEIDAQRKGGFEPKYTNYTYYWQLTLDYIFVIDPPGSKSTVLRLLRPHKTSDIAPGLPKKGVTASDHVSLGAALEWRSSPP